MAESQGIAAAPATGVDPAARQAVYAEGRRLTIGRHLGLYEFDHAAKEAQRDGVALSVKLREIGNRGLIQTLPEFVRGTLDRWHLGSAYHYEQAARIIERLEQGLPQPPWHESLGELAQRSLLDIAVTITLKGLVQAPGAARSIRATAPTEAELLFSRAQALKASFGIGPDRVARTAPSAPAGQVPRMPPGTDWPPLTGPDVNKWERPATAVNLPRSGQLAAMKWKFPRPFEPPTSAKRLPGRVPGQRGNVRPPARPLDSQSPQRPLDATTLATANGDPSRRDHLPAKITMAATSDAGQRPFINLPPSSRPPDQAPGPDGATPANLPGTEQPGAVVPTPATFRYGAVEIKWIEYTIDTASRSIEITLIPKDSAALNIELGSIPAEDAALHIGPQNLALIQSAFEQAGTNLSSFTGEIMPEDLYPWQVNPPGTE